MASSSVLDVIDFKKSIIKNIGYELYNKELIITLILNNNRLIVGNLIFNGFELIEKFEHTFAYNQIEEIGCSKTDDIFQIRLSMSDKKNIGLFNVVFYAKTIEWEQLNLYYEYKFNN